MGDHDVKVPGTRARRYTDPADKVLVDPTRKMAIGPIVHPDYHEDDDIQSPVPEGNQDFSTRPRKT